MLRVLSERRAWVVGVGLIFVIAIGLWVVGTRQAAARVSTLVEERLGLDATIAVADVGIGGATLRGVELTDATGGLVVIADRIDARVTPWSALLSGAAGVRALSADGVQVIVDVSKPGVVDALQTLRESFASGGGAPSSGNGSSGSGRTYIVRDLSVVVRDAQGDLSQLLGINIRKEGDEAEASLAQTLVGDPTGDHARAGSSSLALRRQDGGWAISELSVDRGDVRWLDDPTAQREPLALRIQSAVDVLRGASPAAPEDPPAEPSSAPVERKVLSRLSDDVRLRLSHFAVESRTPGGNIERVQDFEASLSGEGKGWFRLVAGGQTSNEGVLSIDVRIQPSEARAEGTVVARSISLALVAPFVPQVPFHEPERGTASAELRLDADSPDQVRIDGKIALDDAALFSERLAPEPIEGITFVVVGDGVWFPAERRLFVEEAVVRMGSARVFVEGELERAPEHYRVDLTAKLPPTPCDDVVGAIPRDVLGPVAGFAWSGSWSGIGRIILDSRDLEATELSIRVRNLCEFQATPRWVRVERFQQPFRHTVIEPDEVLFRMVTGPETENWVPLADISPFLVQAVLSHEDARFYDHGGFAPWAIRDALVRNLEEGRYVVGASTISMQLAKNLYLKREKTIARKVQEVILTWWLENALNKDEILELYLNIIEYGPATYGLRNAASYYFGRASAELSPAEAAFLACILPAPKRYSASYERDALSRSMGGRMSRLLEHMSKRERIGPEALAYGLAEIEQFDFHQDGEGLPAARVLPPVGAPTVELPEPDPFEALFVAP